MWQIMTEEVHGSRATIAETLARYDIDGFNLLFGEGYYKGQRESSVTIQIVGITKQEALTIARNLLHELQQDAILVVSPKGKGIMVER